MVLETPSPLCDPECGGLGKESGTNVGGFLMEDRANFIDVGELEEGQFQFGHVKCEG